MAERDRDHQIELDDLVIRMRYAKLEMPSWRTGIKRRLRAIPVAEIRDAVVAIVILLLLAIGMISPLILAFYTPPTLD